jgi:hypothetical protein
MHQELNSDNTNFAAIPGKCSETGWEAVGWIHLAQDRDQWRVLVNTVMNLRVL